MGEEEICIVCGCKAKIYERDVFLRQLFEGIGDRLQNTPRTCVARTKAGVVEADEFAKDIDEH